MWPATWDGWQSNGSPGPKGAYVTHRIALWIFLILVLGMVADLYRTGGMGMFFLARKFLDLLDWVIFWR